MCQSGGSRISNTAFDLANCEDPNARPTAGQSGATAGATVHTHFYSCSHSADEDIRQ